MNAIPYIMNVLGIKVNIIQISRVIEFMEGWIEKRDFGSYICISNMNDIAYSYKNRKIREAMNSAALSVPDGISLVLLARLYGIPLKRRVYGPDLMFEFFKATKHKEYSHFFYGSTEETLKFLIKNLKEKLPELKIAGFHSPPFRPLTEEEDREIIDTINRASPDVLWVGLGCPKQQLWMYEHKDKIRVPVMVGVGAAFDFLAGTKVQAPRWIRDNGVEWLFRLITEPRRLWKRYMVNGSIFIYNIAKQLVDDFSNGRLRFHNYKRLK